MSDYDVESFPDVKRLRRAWGAALVFSSCCFLLILSVVVSVSVALAYISQLSNSTVDVYSILLVAASVVSFIFISLYSLAARKNEDVGETRPPIRPWHNACFVTLRINSILWLASSIVGGYTAFQTSLSNSRFLYIIQVIEAALSATALITDIIILSLLERCHKPFETPAAIGIRPKLVCRISAFEDLLLDRSVSQRSSLSLEKPYSGRTGESEHSLFERTYPMTRRKSMESPGCLSQSRLLGNSSLPLPLKDGGSNRDWLAAWNSATLESPRKKKLSRARSAYSLSESSHRIDFESSRQPPFEGKISDYSMRPRKSLGTAVPTPYSPHSSSKATPSSSTSNSSYRSPLSIMRTVDYPDIPVQSDLLSSQMRGFSTFNDLKTSFHQANFYLQHPYPAAVHNQVHRRPTTVIPLHLQKDGNPPLLNLNTPAQRTSLHNWPPPRIKPAPNPPRYFRRKTSDIRIPGAYPDIFECNDKSITKRMIEAARKPEDVVDQHTKMIEDAIYAIARKRSDSQSTMACFSVTRPHKGLVASQSQESISLDTSSSTSTLVPSLMQNSNNTATIHEGSDYSYEEGNGLVKVSEEVTDEPRLHIVSNKSPRIPELYFDTGKIWG